MLHNLFINHSKYTSILPSLLYSLLLYATMPGGDKPWTDAHTASPPFRSL
jgi:hypothetical protein